jgi:hypothetical protein
MTPAAIGSLVRPIPAMAVISFILFDCSFGMAFSLQAYFHGADSWSLRLEPRIVAADQRNPPVNHRPA